MSELKFGEQGVMTERDWADVVDGEINPFGDVGHSLEWRPKDRHVTFRTPDGGLVGVAGVLVAGVRVEEQPAFDVVGVGSVIVRRAFRGRGLMPQLMDALLRIAPTLGPERAMLFCKPSLVPLYQRFGFAAIDAPIWVDQPAGRIEFPERAMWRPLHDGAAWAEGRVDVPGLPF